MHSYSEVSPIWPNGAYSQDSVHRIAAEIILYVFWVKYGREGYWVNDS